MSLLDNIIPASKHYLTLSVLSLLLLLLLLSSSALAGYLRMSLLDNIIPTSKHYPVYFETYNMTTIMISRPGRFTPLVGHCNALLVTANSEFEDRHFRLFQAILDHINIDYGHLPSLGTVAVSTEGKNGRKR